MNNLININESGRSSAKELYEFLGLNKVNFARWCHSNIVNNKFSEEGADYICEVFMDEESMPNGGIVGRQRVDYSLSNDFAKKLCMISPSVRGEQARNYYIAVEKQFNSKITQVSTSERFDMSMKGAEFAIRILRPSQASQIKMIETVHKNYGLATNLLPSYTEESLTRSATDLLNEHGKPMSPIAFNKALLKLGILEEQQRPTRGNLPPKKFKVLTQEYFGKNLISPANERETQVHWYPEKFKELLRLAVGA